MSDEVAHVWELGHFYSPVADTRELARPEVRARIWPADPPATPGIDWREPEQVALLRRLAAQPPLTLPVEATDDPTEYHSANPNFPLLDGWLLQAMLRDLRPGRLVEVGCGFSSLLTARVNRECLGGAMDVTCIEPYPPEFLRGGSVAGIGRLLEAPVQEVGLEPFLALGAGDVLFIDTSHVVKTGNDVRFLYGEVLPRLQPGVVVHVHDIFLPWEYPEDWVFGGRSWNEQYLVQAFLAFNDAFQVLVAVQWLMGHRAEEVERAVPGFRETPGGSLWLRRAR
jgi:hypothetical protein